jgi:hypothetical protein
MAAFMGVFLRYSRLLHLPLAAGTTSSTHLLVLPHLHYSGATLPTFLVVQAISSPASWYNVSITTYTDSNLFFLSPLSLGSFGWDVAVIQYQTLPNLGILFIPVLALAAVEQVLYCTG